MKDDSKSTHHFGTCIVSFFWYGYDRSLPIGDHVTAVAVAIAVAAVSEAMRDGMRSAWVAVGGGWSLFVIS